LVEEGLPDAWHVQVDGKGLDDLYSLDSVATLQAAEPRAVITISAAEGGNSTLKSREWTRICVDTSFLRLCRIVLFCISGAAAISLGVYIFKGNRGPWPERLALAAIAGFASAVVFSSTIKFILGSFVWLCHLLQNHTKAFWRGAGVGAVCGALLTILFS